MIAAGRVTSLTLQQEKIRWEPELAGGFKQLFIFTPTWGKQFDDHIFIRMGWFNHQLVKMMVIKKTSPKIGGFMASGTSHKFVQLSGPLFPSVA